jgi:hypothetical protein
MNSELIMGRVIESILPSQDGKSFCFYVAATRQLKPPIFKPQLSTGKNFNEEGTNEKVGRIASGTIGSVAGIRCGISECSSGRE